MYHSFFAKCFCGEKEEVEESNFLRNHRRKYGECDTAYCSNRYMYPPLHPALDAVGKLTVPPDQVPFNVASFGISHILALVPSALMYLVPL